MTQAPAAAATDPDHSLARRAALLGFNFFLIILAYYQVKSASRSLLMEYWGVGNIPYVWIISALTLVAFIGFYHRLVERTGRLKVVLGSCLLFIGLLVAFRALLGLGVGWAAVGFYVFVDIFSVILVEQLWSLANTVNHTAEGRKSYWFVGTGGLIGGTLGGWLAARLLDWTPMGTADLLLSCAALLAVVFLLNLKIGRMGLYREVAVSEKNSPVAGAGWRALLTSRYLLLIAGALLFAQLAQPVVEYQFLATVEANYQDLDERTAFISDFFALLGLVAIAVNLTVTPIVHRHMGAISGLVVQPLILGLCSLVFMAQPVLWVASAVKIADRGLSYSVNRASKELLYIPVDPVHTYQAKAWIDMLGYRLFKVLGAAFILALTQWLPVGVSVAGLSWLTLAICLGWFGVIFLLAKEYRVFAAEPAPA
jgi:AAA family ATP:ADP antiporter